MNMQESAFDTTALTLALHETISSTRSAVDQAVERIMQIVRMLPCASATLDEIELALSEALANAVVHGNREDPAKKVDICGACEGLDKLILIVTDEGQGFDPTSIVDPTSVSNLMATHGRGVFLISRLMDEVEFRLNGRQIILRKKNAAIEASTS